MKGANIAIIIILFLSIQATPVTEKVHDGDIEFEHISIKDGLSQSSVYCILQDDVGFMWFGTQHGLNRYDGHNFKVYDYNPKNPNSLSHNLVLSLCEDSTGILWVGTWGGGLNKYDPETERFMVYRYDAKNPNSLNNDKVNIIREWKRNILWIGTDNGLSQLNSKTKNFKRYLFDEKFTDQQTVESEGTKKAIQVNAIYMDKSGLLLIGTDKGLYKYDSKVDIFNPFPCKKSNGESSNPVVNDIYKDEDGVIWVGTNDGLYQFRVSGETFLHSNIKNEILSPLEGKQINEILKDGKGNLWIGTRGSGIYYLNTQQGTVKNLSSADDTTGMHNNDVRVIFEDRAGLVWIGSNGGGINKYDPNQNKFQRYRQISEDPNGQHIRDVLVIRTGVNGKIWLGTKGGGISCFDPETISFENFLIDSTFTKDSRRNEVRDICEDEDHLWVGTQGAGLYKFNLKKEKFEHYISGGIRSDEYILRIYKDRDGVIWIGSTDHGLTKIEKDGKSWENFNKESKGKYKISDNQIFSILQDRNGIIWIGTGSGGLNRFDPKRKIFFHFLPSAKDPHSISYNFITTLFEDKSGTLWVGTNGGGLNKFNRENENFTTFTISDGLPNNVVYDILEDKEGNLWLSTNKGLSRFNPEKGEFRNYTIRDGLQDYEFNRNAACKDDNGLMYFGGLNGFNVFNPKEMKTASKPPPIVITTFRIQNEPVTLDKSIGYTDRLDLSYRDTFISFEFAALSFSNPEENHYSYKLEPVNNDWIRLGNKHDITLTKLEPGEYTFYVKGANNDNIWNETGKSINISIKPPLWRTLWFQALALLAIIGGFILLVLWRINAIKEKKETAERQKDELSKAYERLQQQVNERVLAEKKLRESEDLYRTLVETSPEAISLCDLKGKFIMSNKQASMLLGYSSMEFIREVRNIYRILTPEGAVLAKENSENVITTGFTRNAEFEIIAKDREKIPVDMSWSLIRDEHSRPKYFLQIARDLREQKEAERQERIQQERLIQIDKMISLGTLVAGVAHELKNPLSFVKWNTEIFSRVWENSIPVLEEHYKRHKDFELAGLPYPETKERLDNLLIGFMEGVKRINEIIESLRNFSRAEDSYAREPVDINKILESSIHLTKSMLKKATKNFNFDPANDLPVVEGNFQKLEQVFINLITNACQALPDNKKGITIKTEFIRDKNHLEVQFMDEGTGIDAKDLKFIADPFFTTKRGTGGTGLGLSISMQIIRDHDGTLTFDSMVGKGTKVTVSLPVG